MENNINFKNTNKEEIIKEFYEWLLERKDVSLNKSIDLPSCREYEDPYIYYPKEIEEILNTKPMQRLKRINQLGDCILLFPNAFYTRYEHSLGVYNRKLEVLINKFQDNYWREMIEKEGRKLELLAELIKFLGHDIGHLPLSHVMEIKIMGRQGIHEEIGKRILLENEELTSHYKKIEDNFLSIMEKVCDEKYDDLNLKEVDESNYDVDRLDYLQRDNLYLGYFIDLQLEPYEEIKVKIDKNGEIQLSEDGSIVEANPNENFKIINVYGRNSIAKIEETLCAREKRI